MNTLGKDHEKECDMKNQVVEAITIEDQPHVLYNYSCIGKLNPNANSSFIELTGCIYGWMVDFFHVLENHCHFQLRVYASTQDITFGDVVKNQKGGYHLTGVFAEILNFDVILGATLMTEERAQIVKFLYPLLETRTVIFIQNDLRNQNHWFMYFEVFTVEIWASILGMAILPTVLSTLHNRLVLKENPSLIKVAKKYVASLGCFFGGNFLDQRNRVLVLICHLSYGMVIWIYYQASLTSKLTERSDKYPFTSLEELSLTDYRLLTGRNTTKIASHFLEALPNSPREKVWKNNMDEHSFIGMSMAAEKLFEEKFRALYYYELEGSYQLAKQNKYCDTLIPWKNDAKILYSVSFNKNFSYLDMINMVAKRMKGSGMIQKLYARYKIVPVECKMEEENVEMGYEKVFPLFLFLMGAMIISFLYMVVIEFPLFKYCGRTVRFGSGTIEENGTEMENNDLA